LLKSKALKHYLPPAFAKAMARQAEFFLKVKNTKDLRSAVLEGKALKSGLLTNS